MNLENGKYPDGTQFDPQAPWNDLENKEHYERIVVQIPDGSEALHSFHVLIKIIEFEDDVFATVMQIAEPDYQLPYWEEMMSIEITEYLEINYPGKGLRLNFEL